jgi:hypothetical protein
MSSANSVTAMVVEMETELPWYIVEAVLHEVDDVTPYDYDDLLQFYSDNQIDIYDLGSGSYRVKIDDGGVISDLTVNI